MADDARTAIAHGQEGSLMARLPYVDAGPGASDPDLRELYATITDLRGSVLNLYRALGNQPAALRSFMTMSRYVRNDSQLDPELRELAILATAYALDVPYEKYHHLKVARLVGVADAKIAAFPKWQDSDSFDPTERLVLSYADQVARQRDVDDETFAALRARFSPADIVDLALTVGWYHLCAAILGPLRIDVEEL